MGRVVAMPAENVAIGRHVAAELASDGKSTFVDTLNHVLDTCGDKRETVARDAGFKPQHFSKVTNGGRGALTLIDQLPYHLQHRLAREFAEAHGFTVTEPSAVELNKDVIDAIDELVRRTRRARMRRGAVKG